jgi:hypothetical protein
MHYESIQIVCFFQKFSENFENKCFWGIFLGHISLYLKLVHWKGPVRDRFSPVRYRTDLVRFGPRVATGRGPVQRLGRAGLEGVKID